MVKFWLFYTFFSYLYTIQVESSYLQKRSAGGHWGYTVQNGPSTWGGVCQIGKKQSPINFILENVTLRSFPSFQFEDSYIKKHKFTAKNNGHTIYVALKDDSIKPTIHGGGLENKFIFEQLHFHWESEHEFDGKRADLEMHLVHYNSKYKSFEEASTEPDGIVVLAVIFDEKDETNLLLEKFFEFILEESEEHYPHKPPTNNLLPDNDEDDKDGSFSLRELLPKHITRFYRYTGSLTTPDCGEVVQWTVFINRLPVSNKTLEAFRTLQDHDGNPLLQNFRPPQKLNGREVYIQLKNHEDRRECESLTGSGTIVKPYYVFYISLFILSKIH